MKKLVALLLSSAMFATVIAGLVGCRDDHQHVDANNDGKCDVCDQQMGQTNPPDTPPEGFKRPTDPRDQSAYEAHAKDGELLGSYVSIADAISAAVANDLDEFEAEGVEPSARGSYVVKKGSTRKLFENMRAYSEGLGDVWWYYQDNGLVGYEYYQAGVPINRLQNSTEIVYQTGSGVEAKQAYNGYGVYDGRGAQLGTDKIDLASRSWELIVNADASIRGIPVREHGATGARYTVDLSEVQIKPAFEGVDDDVYAFMGFVMASGTYSAEVGIACNTQTGEWKQYIADNPNNRVLQVCMNYNIGETVFTSTWHEDGGYFTPDVDSVTLEVQEVKGEDENGDEWWYNLVEITAGDKKVEVIADEEFLNEHGNTGVIFDQKEGFFFSAGLDIVAPGAEVGNSIDPVDYTIGAEFNNLIIEKGEIYFPTEDEISDEDYGLPIPAELRGEYHDIRSEGFLSVTDGIYNYTIVNLLACCDYEINDDGYDTYSFHYTAPAADSSDRAGQLKTYQDKIDSLSAITAENAGQYKTTIDEVTVWYGPDGKPENSKVELRHYLAIDWAPYLNALEVYKNAVQVSEEGQQVIDGMGQLTAIDSLSGWKGWKAPADTQDKKGYLYDELEQFRALYATYEGLEVTDQLGIVTVVGDPWMYWEELLSDYDAALDSDFATKQFTIANHDMNGVETKTGAELFEEFFNLIFEANSHKDEKHQDHGGALCVELSDNVSSHFLTTFRLLFINELLKEEEVPLGYSELALELLANTYTEGVIGTPHDFPYIYYTMRQAVRVLRGECTYLDDELADMVNTYMVGFEFQNGSWKWAWYVNGGDLNLSSGTYKWKLYFGQDLQETGKPFRELIVTYLLPYIKQGGGDMPTKQPFNGQPDVRGVAVDKAVTPAGKDEAGTAWLAKWTEAALSDLTTLSPDVWKGWKSEDDTVKGYLSDELEKFNELYTEYSKLSDTNRGVIAKELGKQWELWVGLSEDYKTATTSAFAQKQFTVKGETFTGTQLVDEFFKAVYGLSIPEWSTDLQLTGKQVRYLAASNEGVAMSWRIMYIKTLLDDNFVKLGYADTIIEILSAHDASGQYKGDTFVTDFGYVYNVLKQVARVQNGTEQLDHEMAVVVNTYMVGKDAFAEGNWNWAFNNGGQPAGVLDIAKDYFGITAAADTKFADLIKPMLQIVVKDGGNDVQINESGLGVTVAVNVPEQTEFGVSDIIREFNELSNLNSLTEFKGYSGKEKGFLEYELGLFNTILGQYNKLAEDAQALVTQQVGAELWEQWETLAEQVAALDAETQDIDVKLINNTSKGHTVKVTQLNVFGGMLNCAFFQNTNTKCTHKDNGYLCCEETECFLNSVRYYYLYRFAKTLELDVDYIDVVYEMLKANGATSDTNADPTLPNGERTLLDFDYLWAVGGQIVRIIEGDCTYLDKELADVVNKYMVANEGNGSQWGVHESFHNGSFSYAYRSVWSKWGGAREGSPVGDLKASAEGWKYYISDIFFDPDFCPETQYGTESYPKTWSDLLKEYLIPILTRDAGADIMKGVRSGDAQASVAPMLVARTVTALTEDPTANLGTDAKAAYDAYTALSLPDLQNVTTLKGGATADGNGAGYVYDSVKKFRTVYEKVNALGASDKTAVINQIGKKVWVAWESLSNAYKALEDSTTKVSIVTADFADTLKEVSALDLVNEFLDCLLRNYDANVANGTALNGYLCMEEEAHFMNSMRALYLHKLIETKGLETTFKFAHDVLDMVIHYTPDGVLKYTNLSSSEGAYKDFEYLWNVGEQLVRLKNGLNHIDAELANVINTYMVASGSYDKPTPGHFGVYESFYNLALSTWYRNGGDFVKTQEAYSVPAYSANAKKVYRYISEELYKENKTWDKLIETYLKPVLGEDILLPPRNDTTGLTGMIVSKEVQATAE